jgi:tRNA modification GTPase
MKSADLVLYIFDVNTEIAASLTQQEILFKESVINYLMVANKTDISGSSPNENDHFIYISAKQQVGIDALKEKIYQVTVNNPVNTDNTIVTNVRHLQSLYQIKKSVEEILKGLNNHLPGDLLAIEIRTCLFHLGEITGEITNEDKLDYIFSKFCIGKYHHKIDL